MLAPSSTSVPAPVLRRPPLPAMVVPLVAVNPALPAPPSPTRSSGAAPHRRAGAGLAQAGAAGDGRADGGGRPGAARAAGADADFRRGSALADQGQVAAFDPVTVADDLQPGGRDRPVGVVDTHGAG